MNLTINQRKRAPLWVFGIHKIQENLRNPSLRKKISDCISYILPKSKVKTIEANPLFNKLQDIGYCEMPNILSSEEIDKLRDTLIQLDCIDGWRKHLGKFTIDNVPKETHTAQILNVLSIPKVIEIANNPLALEICERYFGCKPVIDSIQAWWSLPGHEKPEQAENMHRDNDGIRFLKYFIYLTDVTEKSGPHIYVEGSHISSKGLEIKRYEDKEVEDLFTKDKFRRFTGSKGLSFLEDTYGFHKGQAAETEKRLLLQIRYAVMPTIFLNKSWINKKDNSSVFDTYINKYIIK
jgi:hypothetical protein